MNEGSYFGFYDDFGSLCVAEWRAPGLTVILDQVGTITQIDAPSDGNIYGRQSGAWVVIPGMTTAIQAIQAIQSTLGTAGLFFESASYQNQLSLDANGDLIMRQITGPNAGKSVNLTADKWV